MQILDEKIKEYPEENFQKKQLLKKRMMLESKKTHLLSTKNSKYD